VLLVLAAGQPSMAAAAVDVVETTIAGLQRGILSKETTASEIVRVYLERIKAYNGACVRQPEGLLGRIETIPHAGQINALQTVNLRPKARMEWGFD
jgi:amidase